MDIKEFAKGIFESFFTIFFFAILGLIIYLRLLGYEVVLMRDIYGVFASSIFGALAGVVLYSRREPKRLELLIRHVIHLFTILGICLSVATYIGWIVWNMPNTVIRFTGLIMGIYFAVMATIFLQTKKQTDKMNIKLKERYRE